MVLGMRVRAHEGAKGKASQGPDAAPAVDPYAEARKAVRAASQGFPGHDATHSVATGSAPDYGPPVPPRGPRRETGGLTDAPARWPRPLGRLTSAVEKTAAGATNASWAYAYDKAGNRTSQTRVGNTQAEAGTLTYGYNAAHQLTSINGDASHLGFDADGNETAAAGDDWAWHRGYRW